MLTVVEEQPMAVSLQKRILLKAADLLEDPRRWTRSVEARDASGRSVRWSSPKAVRFCAIGAIERVSAEHGVSSLLVEKFIENKGSFGRLIDLNDMKGRKAVITDLRRLARHA